MIICLLCARRVHTYMVYDGCMVCVECFWDLNGGKPDAKVMSLKRYDLLAKSTTPHVVYLLSYPNGLQELEVWLSPEDRYVVDRMAN